MGKGESKLTEQNARGYRFYGLYPRFLDLYLQIFAVAKCQISCSASMINHFQRARRHRVLSFCRQHNLPVQFQNEVSAHLKLEYL
jgi:hypothetical protein